MFDMYNKGKTVKHSVKKLVYIKKFKYLIKQLGMQLVMDILIDTIKNMKSDEDHIINLQSNLQKAYDEYMERHNE